MTEIIGGVKKSQKSFMDFVFHVLFLAFFGFLGSMQASHDCVQELTAKKITGNISQICCAETDAYLVI